MFGAPPAPRLPGARPHQHCRFLQPRHTLPMRDMQELDQRDYQAPTICVNPAERIRTSPRPARRTSRRASRNAGLLPTPSTQKYNSKRSQNSRRCFHADPDRDSLSESWLVWFFPVRRTKQTNERRRTPKARRKNPRAAICGTLALPAGRTKTPRALALPRGGTQEAAAHNSQTRKPSPPRHRRTSMGSLAIAALDTGERDTSERSLARRTWSASPGRKTRPRCRAASCVRWATCNQDVDKTTTSRPTGNKLSSTLMFPMPAQGRGRRLATRANRSLEWGRPFSDECRHPGLRRTHTKTSLGLGRHAAHGAPCMREVQKMPTSSVVAPSRPLHPRPGRGPCHYHARPQPSGRTTITRFWKPGASRNSSESNIARERARSAKVRGQRASQAAVLVANSASSELASSNAALTSSKSGCLSATRKADACATVRMESNRMGAPAEERAANAGVERTCIGRDVSAESVAASTRQATAGTSNNCAECMSTPTAWDCTSQGAV